MRRAENEELTSLSPKPFIRLCIFTKLEKNLFKYSHVPLNDTDAFEKGIVRPFHLVRTSRSARTQSWAGQPTAHEAAPSGPLPPAPGCDLPSVDCAERQERTSSPSDSNAIRRRSRIRITFEKKTRRSERERRQAAAGVTHGLLGDSGCFLHEQNVHRDGDEKHSIAKTYTGRTAVRPSLP